MRDAMYYDVLPEKLTRCRLCPHGCAIPPGARGVCGVRVNDGGILRPESYGAVTSMALDPIEKKPLRRFLPGTQILSVGGYGCNFHCDFCQNHEISMSNAPFRTVAPDELANIALELAAKGNIGLAYTYNEPLIGYEFVFDCAGLIKKQGQKNVLVTNGYIGEEPLSNLLPLIDAMNIDLKTINAPFYTELGGDPETVLASIAISHRSCHVEVTTLIIPGKNDSDDEMDEISGRLSDVSKYIPLHISRFFPAYKLSGARPAPAETVYRLADIARRRLKYVYTGNC